MTNLKDIEEKALFEQIKRFSFKPLLQERAKNADLSISTHPLFIFCVSKKDLVINNLDKALFDNLLMKSAALEVVKSLNYGNINSSDLSIGRNEKGMPYLNFSDLKGLPEIHVTNSNKENIHISAASINRIGIDIEKKRPIKSPLKNKIFNSDEILHSTIILEKLLSSNKEIDLDLALTTLFSIKEAITKAIGLGLGFDFKKIFIKMDKEKIQAFVKDLNLIFNIYSYYKDDFIYNLVETI